MFGPGRVQVEPVTVLRLQLMVYPVKDLIELPFPCLVSAMSHTGKKRNRRPHGKPYVVNCCGIRGRSSLNPREKEGFCRVLNGEPLTNFLFGSV